MNSNPLVGDELFNIVKSFINYHKQDSTKSKDSNFSIKNIKTIVLSPRAIIFEYHLSIGANPSNKAVPLTVNGYQVPNTYMYVFRDNLEFNQYIMTMKPNKSCVDAIGRGTNKCQGLEEVVLVPYESGVGYDEKDSNILSFVNGLLAGKQSRRGMSPEALSRDLYDYYPRLRAIAIASNTNTVVNAFIKRDNLKTLSSVGLFQEVMAINDNHWYQSTKFQAKYPADKKLEQHFLTIKNKLEKETDKGNYDMCKKLHSNALKAFISFSKIVNKDGVLVDSYQPQALEVKELSKEPTKQEYDYISDQYLKAIDNYRAELYRLVYSGLEGLGTTGVKTALKDTKLNFPRGIEPKERYIKLGCEFNKVIRKEDVIDAIIFYCEVFTTCERKYLNRDLWEKVFSGE